MIAFYFGSVLALLLSCVDARAIQKKSVHHVHTPFQTLQVGMFSGINPPAGAGCIASGSACGTGTAAYGTGDSAPTSTEFPSSAEVPTTTAATLDTSPTHHYRLAHQSYASGDGVFASPPYVTVTITVTAPATCASPELGVPAGGSSIPAETPTTTAPDIASVGTGLGVPSGMPGPYSNSTTDLVTAPAPTNDIMPSPASARDPMPSVGTGLEPMSSGDAGPYSNSSTSLFQALNPTGGLTPSPAAVVPTETGITPPLETGTGPSPSMGTGIPASVVPDGPTAPYGNFTLPTPTGRHPHSIATGTGGGFETKTTTTESLSVTATFTSEVTQAFKNIARRMRKFIS